MLIRNSLRLVSVVRYAIRKPSLSHHIAAEQWQRDAPRNFAAWYFFGRGVGQSNVEAAMWYTKSAKQGHAAGQSNIGAMYELGQGVEQSDVEAAKWYIKAAEQGDAAAQFNLGLM